MQTVPRSQQHESRSRELIADAFAGTPGKLRVFGAISVIACLAFGLIGFALVVRLDDKLGEERAHAAQLVRIQSIRTSLVAADANAANGFLVGGLEPAAARAAYVDGVNKAAEAIAAASNADSGSAAELQQVNRVLSNYTGLIEAARANNRQGYPVGAAYLRQASNSIRTDALPKLAILVTAEQQRVDGSSEDVATAQDGLVLLLLVAIVCLLVTQFWLYRRTRRVLNKPLVLATVLVFVSGVIALSVIGSARGQESDARRGPYDETVLLSTARSAAFDAKSSESLTLIRRGSADFAAFDESAEAAGGALFLSRGDDVERAFDLYLDQHEIVADLEGDGKHDEAVKAATGNGAANRAFNAFERASNEALQEQASELSDNLAQARSLLLVTSLMLLVAGLGAALAAQRGIAQRLQEYR